MQYDPRIKLIATFLAAKLYDTDLSQHCVLFRVVPEAWVKLVSVALQIKDRLPSAHICSYYVEKGLMRIEGECPDKIDNEIMERVFQSLAASSARTCMVCGSNNSERRKSEEGWPSLCRSHYIQYVNYLGEQENG